MDINKKTVTVRTRIFMDTTKQNPVVAAITKQHTTPEFTPSTFQPMRKNDKVSNNSHRYQSGNDNNNNFLTSNRFSTLSTPYRRDKEHGHQNNTYNRNYNNSATSFFGARKANIIAYSQNNKSNQPPQQHHHGEFHRTSSSGSDKSHDRSSPRQLNNKEREYVNRNKHAGYTPKNPGGGLVVDNEKAAQESVKALETLQQIQEAKPGNKRALLVDLPPYLYSIPALASFFEPYGEVAMLQILPQKRMWDADLIDLLGASMCNRLANQSLCAIVEFYSARMAKFIIGILRKRLPILKFRCALLKPSAAVELTNQAENLGLQNVVVMKAKKVKNAGSVTTGGSEEEGIEESGQNNEAAENRPRQSDSESGLEEMSSNSGTNNRERRSSLVSRERRSVDRTSERTSADHPSSDDHDRFSREQFDSSEHEQHSSEHDQNEDSNAQQSAASDELTRDHNIVRTDANGQRYVTSFRIKLNR